MAEARQRTLALLQGFTQLGNAQKLGFILGLAAFISIIVGVWLWSTAPDYRVLFTNVNERDAGTIVASLQQMNVPYRMDQGGTIRVPAEQVYDVRLRLASQGLPKGGLVGYELIENPKFGTSQFVEQVNYQRALEGELARTIQSLAAVQAARVHLAIPRPSVFVRDNQKPSASVLINVYPGRSLTSAQIGGIAHLVSSSVPDLPASNVTVVDQTGNLLSRGTEDIAASGLNPTQLSYLHQIEQSYARRIESILAPIVGPDNVRAQVTAAVDFAQIEQTSESYKPNPPNSTAIRSQQTTETIGGQGGAASGVPGALSNQPPGSASAPINAPAGGTTTSSSAQAGAPSNVHRETTSNYELDKTIRHVRSPVGTVTRLSVGVVVNYRKVTDRAGKVAFNRLTDQEMKQISDLVREAVGFNQERGDTVNVVNASFNVAEREAAPEASIVSRYLTAENITSVLRFLVVIGVVLFLVLGVLRPILQELIRTGQQQIRTVAQPAEAAPTPQPASRAPSYEQDLRAVKDIAKQDPRIVANVVKDWVGQDE